MDDLTWVFAPGSNSSHLQVLKYARSWKGEHGEIVVSHNACLSGGDFIGVTSPVTSMNFSEIVHRDPAWHADWQQWPRQAFQAVVARFVQWRRSESFRVRCAGTQPVMDHHSLDWRQFNLGQHKDMQTVEDALSAHRARLQSQHTNGTNSRCSPHIVLYGVSRGAAAIVNFVASATPEQLEGVVGIVLEGCPDSLTSVLQNKLSWMPWLVPWVSRCWEWVTSYRATGPAPIDNIDKIPLHIPVLLITSLGDTLIPPACAQRLKVKLQGRRNVQLVVLPTAPHPAYSLKEPDCSQYRDTVLAFYDALIKR